MDAKWFARGSSVSVYIFQGGRAHFLSTLALLLSTVDEMSSLASSPRGWYGLLALSEPLSPPRESACGEGVGF
eukprot:3328128-Pleurochrysis_carterae.AAC.1